MNQLAVFKEIKIGEITRDQLIRQLVESGVKFNEYAKMLFEHQYFEPCIYPEKIELVKVTLSDLEMENPCSFEEVINQASIFHLKLCPLYCAAFLRLEYLDQPEGPYLTVVSAKPESGENHPNGFYIRNVNNTLWLRGYCAIGPCQWPLGNEFCFLKSSKKI